ncbi:MAG: AAA family ATPase [Gammaproteobacteria bacterium]|nr:AAA family ATPase [Gammaproteobacteria bacterium]
MPIDKFKIAFIGSHGVGKTTLCFGLAARLKSRDLSVEVVHEVARRCPLPINEETTVEAQAWILHTQIAEELLASVRYPIVICDRSVVDNYAYLNLAHGPSARLERVMEDWLESYDKLFLVPVASAPRADGLRATDPTFQQQVDIRVRQLLAERGILFHDLGAVTREHWLERSVDLVLQALQPPQLDLL